MRFRIILPLTYMEQRFLITACGCMADARLVPPDGCTCSCSNSYPKQTSALAETTFVFSHGSISPAPWHPDLIGESLQTKVVARACHCTLELSPHLLVHFNTQSTLGNVPDDTSLAVVPLERHTGVHGRVHLDVDVVPTLEHAQRIRKRDNTIFTVSLREEIPGSRA